LSQVKPNLTETEATYTTNWFVNPRPNPGAKTRLATLPPARDGVLRLFFFPYAGSGPAVFSQWLAQFPNNIEGWIAHLPGRGSRYQEPAYKDVISLVDSLSQAIEPLLDRPYAFFGHSFGALVAFELARHLRRCGLPQPIILFVSGCGAPHTPDPHPFIHALPDAEFLAALKEFNGIPPELLRQPEAMDLLLPLLRADFEAFETYIYTPEHPLQCRIVAFGGTRDPRVSREGLEAWASQTDFSFQSEYFPGDHFFINTVRESIITSITTKIKTSS